MGDAYKCVLTLHLNEIICLNENYGGSWYFASPYQHESLFRVMKWVRFKQYPPLFTQGIEIPLACILPGEGAFCQFPPSMAQQKFPRMLLLGDGGSPGIAGVRGLQQEEGRSGKHTYLVKF